MKPQHIERIGPYRLYNVIGEGAFSIVRLARIDNDDHVYACKIIPKTKSNKCRLAKSVQLEIKVLQQLDHPNIVLIHDIFNEKNFYFIIMEYCPNGNLLQEVINKRRIEEEDATYYMYQVFSALKHMHDMGICHRDLKLDNILIGNDKSVKISDFGLSRYVDKNGLTKTPVGSPCYVSPECLSGNPYDARKSDVWSTGVILYTMLTGRVPWTGKAQKHIFTQIKLAKFEMPQYLSLECKRLINAILTKDCEKRLTVDQILNHPWFENERACHKIPQLKPRRLISLKKIDMFFGKDIKSGICQDLPPLPTVSNSTSKILSFDKVLSQIKNNSPSVSIKKRTKSHKKKRHHSNTRKRSDLSKIKCCIDVPNDDESYSLKNIIRPINTLQPDLIVA